MTVVRPTVLLIGLFVLVVTLFGVSLLVGPAEISLGDGLAGLFAAPDTVIAIVMQEIRLPRAILGAAVGATLGLSGAALQGYLRNPLADPGLLGINSAAALGAVIAIYTGLSQTVPLALPVLALAGAALAVACVRLLAGGAAPTITLILAGVAVTSFSAALTSLALNLSPNPFAALEIVFWMLGSLKDRAMTHVWLALPFMALGWVMLAQVGRALDALTLGEDAAASLGFRLSTVQWLVVGGTALSVGAATAVSGAIGFVGLVVPHIMRPLVGAQPSRLLLASALGGAAVVLAADIAVRVIAPERDLKLGVLTALVGAPFFLLLIYRTRRALT